MCYERINWYLLGEKNNQVTPTKLAGSWYFRRGRLRLSFYMGVPPGLNPLNPAVDLSFCFISLQTDYGGSHIKYLRQTGGSKCTKAKQQSRVDEGTR